MVKLDASILKYLSKEDFRVLTAVEMGHKNHDLVPVRLINIIANLKFGGCFKSITVLHKHKLLYHEKKIYDGYRLTYFGYDYLVLKTLTKRGVLSGLGNQIGTGKESDIYIAVNDEKVEMAIKFQRLGRLSFRTVKRNRDYLGHRKSASWLYLSRLAALKEYAYMKALHEAGFPVPKPISQNRHAVLMELIPGTLLNNIKYLANVRDVYKKLIGIITKFAQHGLIHGDFNEFNIIVDDNENVTVIDFPQMVSIDHENAEMYFDRDVNCIRTFFEKRFGYVAKTWPKLKSDVIRTHSLDKEIAASGFTKELEKELDLLTKQQEEDEKENEKEKKNEGKEEIEKEEEEEEEIEGEGENEENEENEHLPEDFKVDKEELENIERIEKLDIESEEEEEGVVNNKLHQNNNKNFTKINTNYNQHGNTVQNNQTTTVNNSKIDKTPTKEGTEKKKKNKPEDSFSDSFSESSDDEGKPDGNAKVDENTVKKRLQIQKRVRHQIAQKEKRRKVMKNEYKQRERRAVVAETKALSDIY